LQLQNFSLEKAVVSHLTSQFCKNESNLKNFGPKETVPLAPKSAEIDRLASHWNANLTVPKFLQPVIDVEDSETETSPDEYKLKENPKFFQMPSLYGSLTFCAFYRC